MIAHVRKYVPSGTYGFLSVGDSTEEVFFHLWVFDALGGPPPIVGEVVDVEVRGEKPEQGLPRADKVTRVSLPEMKTGTVVKFDQTRGYGFVSDEKNDTYYLHKSDISGGGAPLPGSPVRFYVGSRTDEGHRPRACHVTLGR